jgi:hypothetical protein
MVTDEIKLIRTKKEGDDLLKIQENYPNSIIFVDSEKDKNVYIGLDRVEQGYNVGVDVDDDKITNSVGGISGYHASELKGKPISEILDIILFASNNNLELKGVIVVDKIDNLTDSTLTEVYQGMVVSVLEDDSLYILLSEGGDSDSEFYEREWKKVGTDIDKEEIKEYTNTLTEPITVAGLSGNLGANIYNDKTYYTIEDILRDLLCKEIYPEVSLSTINPKITFSGIKGNISSNYLSLMKVGSVLDLNSIELYEAYISNCSREGLGFTYGYSSTNDNEKDGDKPQEIKGESSLVGKYSLTETYSQEYMGEPRTVESSENYKDVKFDSGSVKIGLGSNTINFKATSPSGVYSHPEYPECYVISNLGNTSSDKKLSKLDSLNGTVDSVVVSSSISVTGVYPVYNNISSGSLIEDTIEMPLTASKTFEFDVPSEVSSNIHFKFDYPATHTVTSFEIWNKFDNKFVEYAASYEKISETVGKNINGVEYQYNRFITTGNFQGEGKYKITLSKGLDKE